MSRFPFIDEQGECDLNEAVRRAARKPLPKKFYQLVTVEAEGGGFVLRLDGRTARTPARNVLLLPGQAIAEAIAEEWNRQGEEIDPDTMPFTRIANSATDAVAGRRQEVVDDLLRYAGSDLVFYRSEGPERLVSLQSKAWNPVIEWSRECLGAHFRLAEGIIHVSQPEEALDAVRKALDGIPSEFSLASLHVMTTLAGSILIPLAHIGGLMNVAEAWHAAHVDELYQETVWGQDEEAALRRNARERDFRAASRVALLMA